MPKVARARVVERIVKKAVSAQRKRNAKQLREEKVKTAAEQAKVVKSPVKRELIRRVLARKNLLRFIQRMDPKYDAGWVHELICRKLERFLENVMAGKSPRLMVFLPPRHGKSYIASQLFPAWALGRFPELNFIVASYGARLPLTFSRSTRAYLRDPLFKTVFPQCEIDPENENVEGWSTTSKGGYTPVGIGGGILGRGADIFVFDDVIASAEEAYSEVIRERNFDWYTSTAYTRLSPKSGILVIQQRWHDDDMPGRLLSIKKERLEDIAETRKMMALDGSTPEEIEEVCAPMETEFDNWDVINFPAIAENDEYVTPDLHIVDTPVEGAKKVRSTGDALHESRWPLKRLKLIRSTQTRKGNQRYWSSMYQQNPVPDDGDFFLKEMFHYEPRSPDRRFLRILIAGDLAIGTRTVNDYTAFAVGGIDYEDKLHILEVVRKRWDIFGIADTLLDLHAKYHAYMIGIESGQLELALRPVLKRAMKARRLYPTMAEGDFALKPVTDKRVRANPLQGRMQAGQVIFPLNVPWLEMVRHEMLRFDGGTFDDMVDALAWLARMAGNIPPPSKPRKAAAHESWKDRVNAIVEGQDAMRDPMAA